MFDKVSAIKKAVNRPAGNKSKRVLIVIILVAITALLIAWVCNIARKTNQYVSVIMFAQDISENRIITDKCLQKYDMLIGEFEKFSTVDDNGITKRRIFLWSEKDKIINSFAAYRLKAGTYAEKRDFVKNRVSNVDNLLYSFPGKVSIALEVASSELQAFKSYIKPGDRINIEAIYSERESVVMINADGTQGREQIDTFKSEPLFTDMMIADLLNNKGESILDIYANYRTKSVYEQAALDQSSEFQDSVEPKSLVIAVTPDEYTRYNKFKTRSNIKFSVALPQRAD